MRWEIPPEARRFGAMVSVFVAAGLVIAWLLLPPAPPAEGPRPPPVLRVAGSPVPAEGDPVGNALDLVRRYAYGELEIKLPDGSGRKLRRGALGAEIDRVRVARFVREAVDPKGAVRRAHEAKNGSDAPIDVPLPIVLDASTAIATLLAIKAELDAPAKDAYVDLEARKLQPEKIGYRLDVYGTLARIDAALLAGQDSIEAAVEKIPPKLVWPRSATLKFDAVLGYFETRYSTSAKAKDRTYNLRLAASKVDGVVVMPGEIFDFNAVVGPRDEAHGYRVAPVIAQGELVDGLGGGTCQISGTLHGAAFFAGLEIVERYRHSRPSYYIKMGLDATVVYPTINFRFRNPFPYPVVLHEKVANGVVRAEVLGPERRHTVSYFRRIDEVIPFEEIERPNPKLPEGVRVLAQRGIPGFRTTSSRVVRDGAYAVRTKWVDSYPPTTQIIHVGTGPKGEATKVVGDEHPEYVVDEYLVITQGPDIRTPGVKEKEPGGGTVESREPGRTGRYGWTEKAGLTKYHETAGEKRPGSSDVAPAEGEASEKKGVSRDATEADAAAGGSAEKAGASEDDGAKAERGGGKGGEVAKKEADRSVKERRRQGRAGADREPDRKKDDAKGNDQEKDGKTRKKKRKKG